MGVRVRLTEVKNVKLESRNRRERSLVSVSAGSTKSYLEKTVKIAVNNNKTFYYTRKRLSFAAYADSGRVV